MPSPEKKGLTIVSLRNRVIEVDINNPKEDFTVEASKEIARYQALNKGPRRIEVETYDGENLVYSSKDLRRIRNSSVEDQEKHVTILGQNIHDAKRVIIRKSSYY